MINQTLELTIFLRTEAKSLPAFFCAIIFETGENFESTLGEAMILFPKFFASSGDPSPGEA
jgi:hypothetical protein